MTRCAKSRDTRGVAVGQARLSPRRGFRRRLYSGPEKGGHRRMIVKCDQCQTRFKIPDEKVTEKGVKVRCTKCQHTFRVKRTADGTAMVVPPGGGPTPPPPAEPTSDPFAAFGV